MIRWSHDAVKVASNNHGVGVERREMFPKVEVDVMICWGINISYDNVGELRVNNGDIHYSIIWGNAYKGRGEGGGDQNGSIHGNIYVTRPHGLPL